MPLKVERLKRFTLCCALLSIALRSALVSAAVERSLADSSEVKTESVQRPPNIVLILADDLGFSDIAPYGSEISTPSLSTLAAAGVSFTNYHTAANCAPARAMLLTGVDAH